MVLVVKPVAVFFFMGGDHFTSPSEKYQTKKQQRCIPG